MCVCVCVCSQNGQFHVGDGKKFKSLDQLVDHFKQAPMVETSGNVVRLKQPVNATRVISSHIHGRITDLMKTVSENFGKAGFWEEFEQLQQQEHKSLYSRKEGAKPENKKKNRYKNILPCEEFGYYGWWRGWCFLAEWCVCVHVCVCVCLCVP